MQEAYSRRTRMVVVLAFCVAGICCLGVPEALSQEDFFSSVDVDIPASNTTNNAYSLFGWATQKIGYGLQAPGAPFSRQQSKLSKVETSLFAQFDTSITDNVNFRFSGKAYRDFIYTLKDNPQFTADEVNTFRTRFEVKDFFLERQFDNGAYVKLGNQTVAWGLAEYLRVTDLVNTEDQYTLGQQDLEDLRLQVPAALLSFNIANWALDSVVTYRAGRDDIAPAKDEFDPFLRLRDTNINLTRSQPSNQYEVFMRASTHWSSGDLQIIAGEFNDNSLSVTRIDDAASASPMLEYSQDRLRALGFAGNWVYRSWLMFGEIALHKGKAIRPAANEFFNQINGWAQQDQILSAAGVEYSGLPNTVLTLEVDNTHTRNYNPLMAGNKDQFGIGARLRWAGFNERLEIVGVWNALIDADTRVGRVTVSYNFSDTLDLGLLWVNYSSKRNSLFYDYRKNDILQLQLQYNFQI